MVLNIWPFNIRQKQKQKQKKKIILFSLIGTTLVLGGVVTTAVLLSKNDGGIILNNSDQFSAFVAEHTEYIHNETMGTDQNIGDFFLDQDGRFKTNLVWLWNLSLAELWNHFYYFSAIRGTDCKMKIKHSSKSIKMILLKQFAVDIDLGGYYKAKSYIQVTLKNNTYHYKFHFDAFVNGLPIKMYENIDLIGLHFANYNQSTAYSMLTFDLEGYSVHLLKIHYPHVNII